MSDKRILPDDSNREQYPLFDGLLAYFPSALCEVARWSIAGNNKHNPGEPLHWAREKSQDHENKIMRHLLDARQVDKDGFVEAVALAWRALALLQTILEERGWAEGKNAKWIKEKDERTGITQLCAYVRAHGNANWWSAAFTESITREIERAQRFADSGKSGSFVAGVQEISKADSAERSRLEDRDITSHFAGHTITRSKITDLQSSSSGRLGK